MRSSSRPVFVLLFLLGACQSAPQAGGSTRSDPNIITQEELEAIPALTVYQAVQRLRPAWLRPRGGVVRGGREQGQEKPHTAQVFVDGMPRGGLQILRELDVRDYREVRYLSGSDATTRYGTGYPGGIIDVLTKRAS